MVSSTPRPHFTSVKDPVPILQEAGWAPGPAWTGGKSRPQRDSIPDHASPKSVAIPTELPGPYIYIAFEAGVSKIDTQLSKFVIKYPNNLMNLVKVLHTYSSHSY